MRNTLRYSQSPISCRMVEERGSAGTLREKCIRGLGASYYSEAPVSFAPQHVSHVACIPDPAARGKAHRTRAARARSV
jgi:hypothetical protein